MHHDTPDTPRRHVVDVRHGVPVVDPYRWLEGDAADGEERVADDAADSEERVADDAADGADLGPDAVADWVDAQNAFADDVLDLPARDALADAYEAVASVADYGPIDPAGGRLFQRVRAADAERHALCVREPADAGDGADAADRRVLVDPADESGETSLDWFAPGPDGERVAVGVAEGGDEQYDVRVVDVETGAVRTAVADAGRTTDDGFAWTGDGTGFYYVATDPDDQLSKTVRYHALDGDGGADDDDRTGAAADPVVLDDVGRRVWPGLEAAGDVLVVELREGWEASTVRALRADADERAAWAAGATPPTPVPVIEGVDATTRPILDGDALYLLTDHDAPRSRLLACPVADALADPTPLDPDDLAVALPEREGVLRDVVVADRLVAHYHEDARSAVVTAPVPAAGEDAAGAGDDGTGDDAPDATPAATVDGDGDDEVRVDLPGFATVDGLRAADSGAVYCTVETFARPRRTCRADPATGALATVDEPDVGVDVGADLAVDQWWFESADGTAVPAFVVRRADLADGEGDDGTGPGDVPTLLTGYGGFRVNRTPTFDRFRAPWLRAGGAYVLATLRGGTEYGEPWHDAGRRHDKERTFEDATAVAEGLVDRGLTRPARLGVAGGSNGGLLVAALLVRRPDLFGAARCGVPLTDMLRFDRFLIGEAWTTEYGDPGDPADFAVLRGYSPSHNVLPAAYPPTLVTTAAGDTRVHPAHARKFVARLQAATTGDAPIALRTRTDTGHGTGKSTSMLVAENAEEWGFLAHHLGLDLEGLGAGSSAASPSAADAE